MTTFVGFKFSRFTPAVLRASLLRSAEGTLRIHKSMVYFVINILRVRLPLFTSCGMIGHGYYARLAPDHHTPIVACFSVSRSSLRIFSTLNFVSTIVSIKRKLKMYNVVESKSTTYSYLNFQSLHAFQK